MKDVQRIFVHPNDIIEETIRTIQREGLGIALVVDRDHRLINTITDGDIRRAILKKIPLHAKISRLFKYRSASYPKPVVAPVGTSHEELLAIMKEKVLRHIPLLDEAGRVVELVWISELLEEDLTLPVNAIVMAGGRGQRLFPLTQHTPKPMLPIDNRPLMERIIKQLRKSGIMQVDITTSYKADVITSHFGDGNDFGVKINYIHEPLPLGTAGALSLMDIPDKPTLIINGDVLTQLDFRAMYEFHRSHEAIMTVGVRKCEFKVPYGVVEIRDVEIKSIIEKPIQTFIVNAGIYLLEPIAYRYIPSGKQYHMTELLNRLVQENHRVISFPIQEYWLDIGHPEDYKQAEVDVQNGKI